MVERLSKKDVNYLARGADVTPKTVRKLLKGGVSTSDIGDVLDLRNTLVSYTERGRIYGQVTLETILEAYEDSDDIDDLEAIFTRAADIARHLQSNGKLVDTGLWNESLHEALNEYKAGGISSLDI